MAINMFEYYEMVKKYNIDIVYSGSIWAEGIEGIGGTLRKRLEYDELPLSASQSVFSVFVEQMNNMLMYSAEKELYITEEEELEVPKGIFVLSTEGTSYYVQSGNVMKSEHVPLVKNKIDYLNTLDKKSLRKYYKEQIKSENDNPESKGAGLGLIEIARRATAPIEYTFTPKEDGLTFFAMFITIDRGGK